MCVFNTLFLAFCYLPSNIFLFLFYSIFLWKPNINKLDSKYLVHVVPIVHQIHNSEVWGLWDWTSSFGWSHSQNYTPKNSFMTEYIWEKKFHLLNADITCNSLVIINRLRIISLIKDTSGFWELIFEHRLSQITNSYLGFINIWDLRHHLFAIA